MDRKAKKKKKKKKKNASNSPSRSCDFLQGRKIGNYLELTQSEPLTPN